MLFQEIYGLLFINEINFVENNSQQKRNKLRKIKSSCNSRYESKQDKQLKL